MRYRLIGMFAAALLACGGGGDGATDPVEVPTERLTRLAPERPRDVAVIRVAGLGDIRVELLREIAPKTVSNFEKLVSEGFYDGTNFHRVMPGFMIQGGDPLSRNQDPRDDGRGGPGYTIEDEFSDLPHLRGIVSMANKGVRNSGASQFFIVHGDSPELDGYYSAFGRVVAGMDVVDAITRLEIDTYGRYGPVNRPYPESAMVESIRIEPAREAAARLAAGAASG
jgi:peptidyl-prolyl cis-trans isomerase B (cyclophilin B)